MRPAAARAGNREEYGTIMKSISLLTVSLVACAGSALAAPHTLEGAFGRVEVDTERPALTALTLRRADGSLEPQSLLSPKGASWLWGVADWGTQALTYAADEAGRRYESRNRAPESVEISALGVSLHGVTLTAGAGEPVAREDWTVERSGDDLVWTVERTWLRPLKVSSVGTPALFFSMRPIDEGHLTYSYTFLQTVLLREPAFRLRLYGNLYD